VSHERIRQLISKGDLKQALDELLGKAAARSRDLADEVTLLLARYATLEREVRQGIIPGDAASAKRAQLEKATLGLSDWFEEDADDGTSRVPFGTTAAPTQPIAPPPGASPTQATGRPLSGFVSYAHDKESPAGALGEMWLDALLVQLKPLQREQLIDVWSDRDIRDGSGWNAAIEQRLWQADFGILLVSAAFLASDYVYSHEVPILLERARQGLLSLFILVLDPCDLKGTVYRYPDPKAGPHSLRLGDLQAAHRPDRPLSALQPVEAQEILASLAAKIRKLAASASPRPV
jgi:hypothetical protein